MILVKKGDIGYVGSIGTFLQRYYIYGVEFVERGYRVGMKARELVSLDADAGDGQAPGAAGARVSSASEDIAVPAVSS